MLKAENCCLAIVDIQGKLATLMHEKELFFDNTVRMIRAAKVLNIPILWNEQIPDKLGPTQDQIKKELEGSSVLVKTSFSCCGNPDFISKLNELNRHDALIVGMETHVCVYQTALDMLDNNYGVHIVSDAVSSRIPENKKIGLKAMREAGAKITSVEMSLFEILGEAQGDQFREIIKIIK